MNLVTTPLVHFNLILEKVIPNSVKTKEFEGVYASGATTDDGGTATEDLLTVAITPGKHMFKVMN